MALLGITSLMAFSGLIFLIAAFTFERAGLALIAFLLVGPAFGDEIGLWKIPFTCAELQARGCTK